MCNVLAAWMFRGVDNVATFHYCIITDSTEHCLLIKVSLMLPLFVEVLLS